ncbi:MAG TPA: GNAT family N-acetyltransferase [Vicinamibacterales bacterium]|nr:GNAT family N-acetyltransferase [Vicinamibacterales bacterium]
MSAVPVALAIRRAIVAPPVHEAVNVDYSIRAARESDADAIHRLISEHLAEGRLLPRSRDEIRSRVHRFIVASDEAGIVACADLAPLSRRVAEVRSLVVADEARSRGICRRLVQELERRALAAGFATLCAFTHAPGYFVKMGFSVVPHTWLPEKIEADCRACAQFRRCGQYAVMLPLVASPVARVPAESAHA